MALEGKISPQLSAEEAGEVLTACINQLGQLEVIRQDMLSRTSSEKEIAAVCKRIRLLHRAEKALLEAMG